MRQEGADTNHFGAKLFDKQNILNQVFYRLSRTADHYSGACLIADVL